MISSCRRNLRKDNLKVSFRDINYYNLDFYKHVTGYTGSTGSAKFFRDCCKLHAIKNAEATNYFTIYRWVKWNYVSYYFCAYLVNYNYNSSHDSGRAGTIFCSTDVNSTLGSALIYLHWYLDDIYQGIYPKVGLL